MDAAYFDRVFDIGLIGPNKFRLGAVQMKPSFDEVTVTNCSNKCYDLGAGILCPSGCERQLGGWYIDSTTAIR